LPRFSFYRFNKAICKRNIILTIPVILSSFFSLAEASWYEILDMRIDGWNPNEKEPGNSKCSKKAETGSRGTKIKDQTD
jgi:hypothetical protein